MEAEEKSTTSFTKVRGGKMYLVSEVDMYIKMLQDSYIEVAGENEKTKKAHAQDIKRAEAQIASILKEMDSLEKELKKAKEESGDKESEAALREKLTEAEQAGEELFLSKKQIESDYDVLAAQVEKVQVEKEELLRKIEELQEQTNLVPSSQGGSEEYISIIEFARALADSYVADVEEKMDSLLVETETTTTHQLNQARNQSFEIVRDAKQQSEEILQTSEKKVKEIMEKARSEYAEIRALIEKSSREYAELTSKANGLEILKI